MFTDPHIIHVIDAPEATTFLVATDAAGPIAATHRGEHVHVLGVLTSVRHRPERGTIVITDASVLRLVDGAGRELMVPVSTQRGAEPELAEPELMRAVADLIIRAVGHP